MSRLKSTLLAACFGFASASAVAQAVAPPVGGSSGKGSAAVAPQDPTASSSKNTKAMSEHPAVNKAGAGAAASSVAPEPTGKDSMVKDNMPKHPAAAEGTKASTSK